MNQTWQALIANLAVVALCASIWTQASDWLDTQRWAVRKGVIGVSAGLAAVVTMMMAIEVSPGIFFDLRAGIIALGAFFSGPVVAVIAAVLAGLYRLQQGGAGMWIGVGHIIAAALIGLVVRRLANASIPRPIWVLVLAASVATLMLVLITLLPEAVTDEVVAEFAPPIGILSFIATATMGLAILKAREGGRERRVLASALAQTPEFIYIKDTASRFLAANDAVARHYGLGSGAEILGKTDRDLTTPERADTTHAQERRIMATGEPLLDFEEGLPDSDGVIHWYRTSKVPLRDKDGRVMGLAGVTVDTTRLKALEHDLVESRDRLSLALSEMSNGLAVFDAEGYLRFCNEQYRQAFPRSAHTRVAGAHITDILRAVAQTGEQLDVPEDDVEGWIARVASLLRVPNTVTIELFDGRHLQLRNKPASNDNALVIVSDVTEIKMAERALIDANADLSRLASTDSLTGLPNRRIFDETLPRDMARTGRAGSPLCLLLIDVDHFKAYNDRHGHLAGDRCLIMVARAIRASLLRPADLAARYGGEEFAVILPDTDRRGAVQVAERIRKVVTSASLDPAHSTGSRLTVSVGAAEYDLARMPETPADLIARADAALYAAKAAGRDRVIVDPPVLRAVSKKEG